MKLFLLLGSFLPVCAQLSSSFIEEEHQVWYFLWMSLNILMLWHAVIFFKFNKYNCGIGKQVSLSNEQESRNRKVGFKLLVSLIVVLILNRFLRKLNQTGDKWSHLPDIGNYLVETNQKPYLSVILLLSLCVLVVYSKPKSKLTLCLHIVAVSSIYCYRSAVGVVIMPCDYPSSR